MPILGPFNKLGILQTTGTNGDIVVGPLNFSVAGNWTGIPSGIAGVQGATGPTGARGPAGPTGPGAVSVAYGSLYGAVGPFGGASYVPYQITNWHAGLSSNTTLTSSGIQVTNGGIYNVSWDVGDSNSTQYIQVAVNGVLINTGGADTGETNNVTAISGHALLLLNAGDIVSLYGYAFNGANLVIPSGASNLVLTSVGGVAGATGGLGPTGPAGIQGPTGQQGPTGPAGGP